VSAPHDAHFPRIEEAMSVGSVTTSSSIYQAALSQSTYATTKNNFKLLETALKAGNLEAAQSAFAEIQKNAPDKSSQTSSTSSTDSQDPFATLASALESGDLAGAKSAFQTIQEEQAKKSLSQGLTATDGTDATQSTQSLASTSLAAMTSGMFMNSNSSSSGTSSSSDLKSIYQNLGSTLDLLV
jgi:hypothetical protein